MSEPVTQLMQELLVWVASRPRTYTDAMEAWQSTCPRHTIWEDAVIDGFIHAQFVSAEARQNLAFADGHAKFSRYVDWWVPQDQRPLAWNGWNHSMDNPDHLGRRAHLPGRDPDAGPGRETGRDDALGGEGLIDATP